MSKITIYLPDSMHKEIKKLFRGIPISQVIQIALQHWLDYNIKKKNNQKDGETDREHI